MSVACFGARTDFLFMHECRRRTELNCKRENTKFSFFFSRESSICHFRRRKMIEFLDFRPRIEHGNIYIGTEHSLRWSREQRKKKN